VDVARFKKAVGAPLEEAAFARKGSSWFSARHEVVLVANLQKSQYEPAYFLNLGFWLTGLGAPPAVSPPEQHCHARVRAEAAFPELADLLDLRVPIGDADRAEHLRRVLRESIIPFMLEGATAAGLRQHIVAGSFRGGLVRVEARRFLGGGAAGEP
jgi:hypothetical protein